MPTEMELTLEQTQQGVSYEVSIPHTLWYTNKVSTIVILDSSKVTNTLQRKESIKAWDQQSSSNTRNQAVVQADRVDIQSRNVGNDGRNARRSFNAQEESSTIASVKGHYARDVFQSKDSGILSTSWSKCCLQRRTEAEVVLSNEQNDFLIAAQMEEFEELSVNICMMARIQQANIDSDEGPSYNFAVISEVQTPSTSFMNLLFSNSDHEQTYHEQPKIINSTNARNAYKEAEKQQILAQKVKQQNVELTKQLEQYKERVRVFGNNKRQTNQVFIKNLASLIIGPKRIETEFQTQFIHDRDKIIALEKEKDDLQLNVSEQRKQILELKSTQTSLKCKLNANEDKYLDDVMNLEAKLKKNENVVMKMSNYLQALFMLGPKPLSVYDPQLKRGLGYENPYTLKQAIFQNSKLYDASYLHSSKVHVNVCDTEEILKDATNSQIK
ncbi:hypothetical protein Tco_1083165 [Tanacetum coccineum]|uniref:Uncharacterized protein n=1 Tax=Tanacetum coccineum TaxID=301880 RepID=A0ABQ5I3Y4_9ASTR